MWQQLLSLFIVFTSPFVCRASAVGSVELNEFSFHKIVNKFDASLVKFDVAFPYGDKHDAYVALSKEVKDIDDLLIAEVGVKDYGEKDNEELAKKYGATKDNFPQVKLFLKDKVEPLSFDDSKGFTTDELRRFVRENTGIYLSLPGCIKPLDEIAMKFVKSKSDDKQKVLEHAKEIVKSLPEKDHTNGKAYIVYMKKILEKGIEFVNTENQRIKNVLKGKLKEEKKKELEHKLNILQTFQQKTVVSKEEL